MNDIRRCEDCKIVLDSDTHFCPKCGRSVDPAQRSFQMPNVQVNALLTSSNLHRLRQEWDEAVADATEALKLDPNNADIASLLGTIYEERGKPDQAVVWYEMALELNPGSTADKARLERVKAQLPSNLTDSFGKFSRRSKYSAMVLVSACLLILLFGVLGSTLRHKMGTQPNDQSAPAMNPPAARVARDFPSNPPRQPGPEGSNPQGPATASAASRTSPETSIKNALTGSQGVTEAATTIGDVVADPRTGVVVVTFSLPPKGQLTRVGILRAATAIARATFGANSDVKFVTARCLVTPGGAESTQIAFMGDVARESIQSLPAQATDQHIQAIFTNPFWNPQIR